MAWQPNLDFFNKGYAYFSNSNLSHEKVIWSFIRHTSPLIKCGFYQCDMQGFDLRSTGYGTDQDSSKARLKAFAEAWERLWMIKMKGSGLADNSNGWAAGRTENEAVERSKNELIERKLLIDAWKNRIGWRKKTFSQLRNRLISFGLNLRGWKIGLYEIKSNLGDTTVIIAKDSSKGSICDSAFSTPEAEQKLLWNIIRNIEAHKPLIHYDLPLIGNPLDHSKYYSCSKHNEAFDFLNNDSSTKNILIEHGEQIESRIVVSPGEFPAIALSFNHQWAPMSWGLQAISGNNPWPHPLA
jgi:hypothetical protein